jgi:hypothetical protein
MTNKDKLIIFDFDFTIADTINEFNPFVSTWTALPGARKLVHYFEKFPEDTFIVTARYENFEGWPLIHEFLEAIGIKNFPNDHVLFAGFLKNFHKKKADIVRHLIVIHKPRKVIVFDDGKANRDVIEMLEDEFSHVNVVVVDPLSGEIVGRATEDEED